MIEQIKEKLKEISERPKMNWLIDCTQAQALLDELNEKIYFVCASCGKIDPTFIVQCRDCRKKIESQQLAEKDAEIERLRISIKGLRDMLEDTGQTIMNKEAEIERLKASQFTVYKIEE